MFFSLLLKMPVNVESTFVRLPDGMYSVTAELTGNLCHKKNVFPQTKRMENSSIASLKKAFELSDDFKEREFSAGSKQVRVFFLDTVADEKKVAQFAVSDILKAEGELTLEALKKTVSGAECKMLSADDNMLSEALAGCALVFIGDEPQCLSVNCRGTQGRAIAEPPTAMVTNGPREGFTEDFKTNLMLLRKRLKTHNFKSETLVCGKITKTQIAVCYLDSVADKNLVGEIKEKINSINIDGIIDSSYISSFLSNEKTNLLNFVGNSEKPDIVASKILEGRIALIVDGSPAVLTVPFMAVEDLQTPDDYYNPPPVATYGRILRIVCVVFALLLPGVYVSLQLFNYEILPSSLLLTIIDSTQAIPVSPIAEMLIITVFFDMLREANARMPKIAGAALGILGAIILGDAAVKAGLLSAPAVFIGALSGIGLYTVPNETMLYTILRLINIIIGGLTGIFGIMLFTLLIISYMVSLENFGTAYFAPFAPFIPSDIKDSIIKAPLKELKTRPESIPGQNKTRQR